MVDTTSHTGGSKKKKKAPQPAEKMIGQLQGHIQELEDKNKAMEDRLLRLAAEFDNYKKRTAKEYEQLIKTANENLILQLLVVLDDFERALQSSKNDANFDALRQGVGLIYEHLVEILARGGLEAIEAVGQTFDPHRHEAVMQIQDGEHPADTVVSEMQKGYLLGDKLIRPARVVVSQGPEENTEKEMEPSVDVERDVSDSEGA